MGRAMAPHVRAGGGPLLRVRIGDLAKAGVERFESRTVGVREGKPLLADGQVLEVANVVWCTGFKPDYGWIGVPDLVGADGWPKGSRGVIGSAPGLYVVGIPFQYAFSSMLVNGAGRDAAYVVDRIAQRAGAAGRSRAMTGMPATR